MSKQKIRSYEYGIENPNRYTAFPSPYGGWHVFRGVDRVGRCSERPKTLPEAVDAAYADADARALKDPTC